MNPETIIQNKIRIALSEQGARLFRNTVGLAYRDGVPIRYGLCNGSSDLIGIAAGRFLAVEVKRLGQHATDTQQAFIDAINALGGIAFVAHSAEEAVKKLKEAIHGTQK